MHQVMASNKTPKAKTKKVPAKRKVAIKKVPAKKKSVVKKTPSKPVGAKRKIATKKVAAKKKSGAKKAIAKKVSVMKKMSSKKTSKTKEPLKKNTAIKKKATTQKVTTKVKIAAKSTTEAKPQGLSGTKGNQEAKRSSSRAVKMKTKLPRKRTVAKTNQVKSAPAVGKVQRFDGFRPYKPGRNESYMSDDQIEHFRRILGNWRDELVTEVSRTVTHMKDEASNFPDPADRATQEEEFSLELRTRDRERKLIKKIDSTLDRLQGDDYGYCDACGIEIGIQRLEARPTASLCIDCKTLAEIKERQELG